MKKCRFCLKDDLAKAATVCPHCGRQLRRSNPYGYLGMFFCVIGLGVLACSYNVWYENHGLGDKIGYFGAGSLILGILFFVVAFARGLATDLEEAK